jgi:predicted secreted protein
MAIAGFRTHIAVATGQHAIFVEMDGAVNYNSQDFRDMLDITDFADDNIRRRVAGLRDVTLEISGHLELEDEALTRIRQAFRREQPIYIRVLHDSSNGFMAPFLVEDMSADASVDDLATVSISLKTNGEFSPTLLEDMSLDAPTILLDALPYERTVTMGSITLSGTYAQANTITWEASPSGLSGTIPFSDGTFSGPIAAGDGVQTITVIAQNAFGSDTATCTVGFYVAGAHSFFNAQNIDGEWNATLSNGDLISEWVNTGTSGLNGTQATPSQQAEYIESEALIGGQPMVGHPSMKFYLVGESADWAFLAGDTPITLHAIAEATSVDSIRDYISFGGNTSVFGQPHIIMRNNISNGNRQGMRLVADSATPQLYNYGVNRGRYKFWTSEFTKTYNNDEGRYETFHAYCGELYGQQNLVHALVTDMPGSSAQMRLWSDFRGHTWGMIIYQFIINSTQRAANHAVTEWAFGATLPVDTSSRYA